MLCALVKQPHPLIYPSLAQDSTQHSIAQHITALHTHHPAQLTAWWTAPACRRLPARSVQPPPFLSPPLPLLRLLWRAWLRQQA